MKLKKDTEITETRSMTGLCNRVHNATVVFHLLGVKVVV